MERLESVAIKSYEWIFGVVASHSHAMEEYRKTRPTRTALMNRPEDGSLLVLMMLSALLFDRPSVVLIKLKS